MSDEMGGHFELPNGRHIGGKAPCFIVAEIGQNHQGDLEIAKQLIVEAKKCGVDCVKFQKTCISEKFTKNALKQKYNGPNSWGKTYEEHKQFLEFNHEEFSDLQAFATKNNIIFSSSAMDKISLNDLVKMKIPFIKLGSGDSNNIPLIEYAALTKVPLIISTGMVEKEDVKNIYNEVKKHHTRLCIMHCVSSYPTPYEDCNLNVLTDYKKSFPDICIGYSGHEIGISVSLAAVALGAKVIERHFTLNKAQKGSDHSCSLEPNEMAELVKQIHIIEAAMGNPIKSVAKSEESCISKLQKSMVAATNLPEGHVLQSDNIKIKVSVPKGVNAIYLERILGKILKYAKLQDEPFFETDFII